MRDYPLKELKGVAPYAGAWIEIWKTLQTYSLYIVAPYAGAWIEITNEEIVVDVSRSLPTRERGLKSVRTIPSIVKHTSLPTRERGLKFIMIYTGLRIEESLPTRERGLKFCNCEESGVRYCRSLRGSVD